MKRSSRSIKVALMAAAAASGLAVSMQTQAAPYLTLSLTASSTLAGSYSSSFTPTSVGQTVFYKVNMTLAGAGTTNTHIPQTVFQSIQSWIASDGTQSPGYPTPTDPTVTPRTVDNNGVGLWSSGLSSTVFSLSASTSGIQPNFPNTSQRLTASTTNGATWTSGTGATQGTPTNRGTGFNDLIGVKLVRAVYTADGINPVDASGDPINPSFDGIGSSFNDPTPNPDGVPFSSLTIASGRFTIGALGATNTLGFSFLGLPTDQLIAGIRWRTNGVDLASQDVNYSIPVTDFASSNAASDPIILYNNLTLVGSTSSVTPSTVSVSPANGTSRASGQTVVVTNTAASGAEAAVLSGISATTSAGTAANGSWGQSGLSTTPIAANGGSQTGTVTATFAANILAGAKLTGTLAFTAGGATVPPSSGGGAYSYPLSATNATNSAPTGAGTTFGTAQTGAVASGDKLAGLSSTESSSLLNTATIVDSTTLAGDTVVTMSWRHRSALETNPGTTPPLPAGITGLISDVVNVNVGVNAPTAFVIEMNYDEAALGVSESFAFAAGRLYLAHMTAGGDGQNGTADDTWANAGSGAGFFRAYQASDLATIGSWGVDPATNQAWAVVPGSIGSQFAVVPEPASLGLLALGALGLIRRRK